MLDNPALYCVCHEGDLSLDDRQMPSYRLVTHYNFLADGDIVGGVDAAHVIGVIGGEGLHQKAGFGHEAGDLGQVVLVLDVAGVEARQEIKERFAVEGKNAGEKLWRCQQSSNSAAKITVWNRRSSK